MVVVLAVTICFCLPQRAEAQQWTTNGNNINNTNTGNVGIGTTTPLTKLDIWGGTWYGTVDGAQLSTTDSSSFAQNVGGAISFIGKYNSAGNYAGFARILGVKEDATGGNYGGALVFQTRANFANQTEYMRISSVGNVGVGTASPSYALDVAQNGGNNGTGTVFRLKGNLSGANNNTQIRFTGKTNGDLFSIGTDISTSNGTRNFQVYDLVIGAPRLTLDSGGNLGIGTTAPATPLHIVSGNGNVLVGHIAANYGAIGFQSTLTANNYALTGSAAETVLNTPTGTSLSLRVNNSLSNILLLNSSGNVGIGTTTPTAKLDVQGDINVSGNINAKYQDMAEWVPSSEAIPAGTVVVLDTRKSNQVIASSESYDTRVAGVISARPGITLGEAGPNKVLVATTGRVKIKVDATRTAISIGDLLVTSDREGYAMKSEPITISGRKIHSPGTLIGKALEPLEKGTGEILVLLSLQ